MSLSGEYEPSRNERDRRQVELYEGTNGTQGGTLNGKPVIILTFKGAKSGKIRKTPLMRIEHDGTYAVVASNGGAPTHPLWYRNILANPLVELHDGAIKQEMRAREVFGEEKNGWGKRARAPWPDFPRLPSPRGARNSGARSRSRVKRTTPRALVPLRGPLLDGTGSPRKELRDRD